MKFCIVCGETLNHNGQTCASLDCRQAAQARTSAHQRARGGARGGRRERQSLELLDAQLRASYAATGG
jgi:hypothetical protein